MKRQVHIYVKSILQTTVPLSPLHYVTDSSTYNYKNRKAANEIVSGKRNAHLCKIWL